MSPAITKFNRTLATWLASFTFAGPIPTQLSPLSNLQLLYLSSNLLSGPLISELGLMTQLSAISIYDNHLSGSIPSQLGALSRLQLLGENNFTGSIPTQLGRLTNLVELEFGSSLTITTVLPSQLGNLLQLTHLALYYAQCIGTIPSQLAQLTSLVEIELQALGLQGSIPEPIFRFPNLIFLYNLLPQWHPFDLSLPFFKFSYFSLLSSFFSCAPAFSSLHTLFSRFSLRCSHLSCLCEGVCLASHSLSLSSRIPRNLAVNSLDGTIPTAVSSLTSLVFMQLNQNQLQGTIPSQLGLLTNLVRLVVHNNKLTGSLPSQLALLTRLVQFSIAANTLHGHLPTQLTKQHRPASMSLNCVSSGLQDDECLHETIDLVSTPLFAVMCGLGGVVMCVVAGLGVFVWRNRGHPCIRASSPMFSVLTLVGLGLLVGAVPAIAVSMWHVSKEARTVACRGAAGLVSFGLVIVMGCVVIRNYVLWRIFNNPQLRAMTLTPAILVRAVLMVVVINTAVITPVLIHVVSTSQSSWCRLDYSSNTGAVVTLIVCFVYLGILAVCSVIVSFAIRNLKSDHNETEQVGRATYNLVTFGTAMILVGLLTNNSVSRLLSLSLTIVMCVMSFIAFVYLPKVSAVRNPQQIDTAGSSTTTRVKVFMEPLDPRSRGLSTSRESAAAAN
eukprot:c12314_g1_i1.p1 GENE.c12314_g1_i1~~c12314_g1_i1.p1  ORF type:complete len:669 (+),score=146.37 c12314_g1_i1:381-2387(+)